MKTAPEVGLSRICFARSGTDKGCAASRSILTSGKLCRPDHCTRGVHVVSGSDMEICRYSEALEWVIGTVEEVDEAEAGDEVASFSIDLLPPESLLASDMQGGATSCCGKGSGI